MDPQTDCPIFRLPQELRDVIYTYAFKPEAGKKIELNDAEHEAPKLDLVLTCRRILNETLGLHQAAYAAYWSNNTFAIPNYDESTNPEDKAFALNRGVVTRKRLQHTAHIVVFTSSLPPSYFNANKLDLRAEKPDSPVCSNASHALTRDKMLVLEHCLSWLRRFLAKWIADLPDLTAETSKV